MSHILHLDSSSRSERSFSRTLSHESTTAWQEAHPDDTVTYRDPGHQNIPFVTESWVAAAYSSPTDLTSELKAADLYVMGIPLYNFSVPAVFKAYLDQIVRVGQTFAMGASGYRGLVKDKKLLVITAQGGSYRLGTPMGSYNFHEPYLRAIFGFIGIADVSFIYADSLMGEEREKLVAAA